MWAALRVLQGTHVVLEAQARDGTAEERGRVVLPSSGDPITPWLRLVRSGG